MCLLFNVTPGYIREMVRNCHPPASFAQVGYSLDLRSLTAILLMKDVAQVLFVSDEIRFLLVPNAMIKS